MCVVSLYGVIKWSILKYIRHFIVLSKFYFSPTITIQCHLYDLSDLFVEDIRNLISLYSSAIFSFPQNFACPWTCILHVVCRRFIVLEYKFFNTLFIYWYIHFIKNIFKKKVSLKKQYIWCIDGRGFVSPRSSYEPKEGYPLQYFKFLCTDGRDCVSSRGTYRPKGVIPCKKYICLIQF